MTTLFTILAVTGALVAWSIASYALFVRYDQQINEFLAWIESWAARK